MMHTAFSERTLFTLLEDYQSSDPRQVAYKNFCLSVLRSQPDCFLRTTRPGHFTASTWVVNTTKDSLLLLFHRKAQKWLQPGGHCDGDVNIVRVAEKELYEETGIEIFQYLCNGIFDIDIHEFYLPQKTDYHFHYDIRFLVEVDENVSLKISKREAESIQWFPVDSLDKIKTGHSCQRVCEKIRCL